MDKKSTIFLMITCFLFSIALTPQIAHCLTSTSSPTTPPTSTAQGKTLISLPLIGAIIAAIVVVIAVALFVLKKRGNGNGLGGASSGNFEARIIKKFNGKPGDPSIGISGFTEGGQPLLIKESAPVSSADVVAFAQVLINGKAQKGIIVAPDFDDSSLEEKVTAMDNGIELQLLRISELMNKRYANRIKELAIAPATFEAPAATYMAPEDQVARPASVDERAPAPTPNEPNLKDGLKPRVFISHSNTKVSDQVQRMLDFLSYDYVLGDKEETTVPIADNKFGLMKDCDCAIVNIAAAEQERRYSGLYILNSNVTSEIDAAYLKYNMQVILLVERKVDLPPNLRGLRRIEYDSDDLSFDAAMDLKSALEEFKKL